MLDIELQDQQQLLSVNQPRLMAAIGRIAQDHGFRRGEVSIILIDDQAIHRVNREHLEHDYPTDVISFVFDAEDDNIEGEIIISTETAIREALTGGWPADDEVLLYAIHGMLHLVGMDDHEDQQRREMRLNEAKYLNLSGIQAEQIQAMAADQDTSE